MICTERVAPGVTETPCNLVIGVASVGLTGGGAGGSCSDRVEDDCRGVSPSRASSSAKMSLGVLAPPLVKRLALLPTASGFSRLI